MGAAGRVNDLAAILLAGGRATRLDGASKPAQEIGGRTLFDIAVAAAGSAGGEPIIAVGPPMPTTSESPSPVAWTREDPPFGGPVAGIIAALEAWQARAYPDRAWTLLLACDLPRAEAATRILLDAVPLLSADIDGVCLGDASSRPQWLIGCYRTAVLRKAAARMPGGGRDAPVRALLADLAITVLRDPGDSSGDLSHGVSADIDTWEDLLTARRAGKDGNDE
jgi:molybdopterin-guanine dinucleotide biosynthesis protein A